MAKTPSLILILSVGLLSGCTSTSSIKTSTLPNNHEHQESYGKLILSSVTVKGKKKHGETFCYYKKDEVEQYHHGGELKECNFGFLTLGSKGHLKPRHGLSTSIRDTATHKSFVQSEQRSDVLKYKGFYKEDKKDGEWTYHLSDGRLYSKGQYKEGKKIGSWIELRDGEQVKVQYKD